LSVLGKTNIENYIILRRNRYKEQVMEKEEARKIVINFIEEAKELLSEAEALGDIEAFNNIDRMIIETIVLFEEIYKEDLYKR
jgi:hypothetical protein